MEDVAENCMRPFFYKLIAGINVKDMFKNLEFFDTSRKRVDSVDLNNKKDFKMEILEG